MSRLSGFQEAKKEKAQGTMRMHPSVGILLAAGALIALVVAAAIVAGLAYNVKSLDVGSHREPSATTITLAPTETATTSTTEAPTTTSTTSTSTTTSSTMADTTTTSTTSTTLSKDMIALCMSSKIRDIYLGGTGPSESLKNYIGSYAPLFPITDCRLDDYKDDCNRTLSSYLADGSLLLKNHASPRIGYPVVVLAKGDEAYITSSVSEFEGLVECGSLKG
jgi:hypothetical protein